MARAVGIAVLVAVLITPPVGLVAIVWIVVVVVHGWLVVGAVPVLLLLLLLLLLRLQKGDVSKVALPRWRARHSLLGIADIGDTHLVAPAI